MQGSGIAHFEDTVGQISNEALDPVQPRHKVHICTQPDDH
jgi:hypothetical protein